MCRKKVRNKDNKCIFVRYFTSYLYLLFLLRLRSREKGYKYLKCDLLQIVETEIYQIKEVDSFVHLIPPKLTNVNQSQSANYNLCMNKLYWQHWRTHFILITFVYLFLQCFALVSYSVCYAESVHTFLNVQGIFEKLKIISFIIKSI